VLSFTKNVKTAQLRLTPVPQKLRHWAEGYAKN